MYEELVKQLRELPRLLSLFHNQEDVVYQAVDAIEELEEKVQVYAETLYAYEHPWISVTERLPKGADESGEICENVWLLFDDGCVYPGWMNGSTKKVYFLDDVDDVVLRAPISRVRAWQPGPKSPKEGEE